VKALREKGKKKKKNARGTFNGGGEKKGKKKKEKKPPYPWQTAAPERRKGNSPPLRTQEKRGVFAGQKGGKIANTGKRGKGLPGEPAGNKGHSRSRGRMGGKKKKPFATKEGGGRAGDNNDVEPTSGRKRKGGAAYERESYQSPRKKERTFPGKRKNRKEKKEVPVKPRGGGNL